MHKEFIYKKENLPKPIISGREDLVELYYKAWELAFQNVAYVKREGGVPCLSCIPSLPRMWVWDSCLMTFITNYSNGTISAFNNLDILYDMRRKEDGFIAMAYDYEEKKVCFGERINPPLFAWAEWQYYLISGDKSRFERVLPAIEGMYSFIENARRRVCGLYWFTDPGASGMDNSPRGAFPTAHQDGGDICHVDLAAQQALSAWYLSMIFDLIGNTEKACFYKEEHARICELINAYHWHEESGFYYDFFYPHPMYGPPIDSLNFLNSKTIAAAWPIIAGAVDENKLAKLNANFLDSNQFYTDIPFASLSKQDVNYAPTGGYWKGGTWASTNYALIKGWTDNGCYALAREAAIKYLDGMCRVYREFDPHTIWECYAPEGFLPCYRKSGSVVRSNFVGWSGIGPITMLIENVIGLNLNAHENTVTFRPSSYKESGIEGLCFNGGYISVVLRDYHPEEGKGELFIKAEKPFRLELVTEDEQIQKIEIAAGESTFGIVKHPQAPDENFCLRGV